MDFPEQFYHWSQDWNLIVLKPQAYNMPMIETKTFEVLHMDEKYRTVPIWHSSMEQIYKQA